MSSDWYLNTKMDRFSGYEIDEFNDEVDGLFVELLSHSPEAYDVTVSGLTKRVIIQSHKHDDKRVLLSKIDDIKHGDLVVHKGDNWLVITRPDDDKINDHSEIQLCHSSLKWLNSNGQVKEAYFTLSSPPTLGVDDEERYIPISDDQRKIIIQSNSNTQQIKENQRFIFDNRAWKVTGVDGLTGGLIYLSLKIDEFDHSRDNVQDRIADYRASTYTLTILNGDSISLTRDDTLQLNVEVTNNGDVVNLPVLYESSDTSLATVDADGLVTTIADGEVFITAKLEQDTSIQDTIELNIEPIATDMYSLQIVSESSTPYEIRHNQEKSYQVNVYKNGQLLTDGSQPVEWTLFADDKVSSTTLASIVEQDSDSCIVANNESNSGYVQLRARLVNNISIQTWQRIEMKSLF
jgi:hypothetical protein